MLTVVVEVERGRESGKKLHTLIHRGRAPWESLLGEERAKPSQDGKLRPKLRAGLSSPGSSVSLIAVDVKSTFLRP